MSCCTSSFKMLSRFSLKDLNTQGWWQITAGHQGHIRLKIDVEDLTSAYKCWVLGWGHTELQRGPWVSRPSLEVRLSCWCSLEPFDLIHWESFNYSGPYNFNQIIYFNNISSGQVAVDKLTMWLTFYFTDISRDVDRCLLSLWKYALRWLWTVKYQR